MMKAILLLATLWFNPVSSDLPNVNTSSSECGKCIKATEHSYHLNFSHDSTKIVVTPEFHHANPGSYQINTVVIDPGHGGHDPGCLGGHSREKHLALSIGNNLAREMKTNFPGLNVIMTRSTDVFVPLHERASIATKNKADLFISIHCNAFSRSDVKGAETYVLGLHATDENLAVAKRENESILLEKNYKENYGYDPNSPEAHIMFSMFQNAFLEQSISFAEKVQSQTRKVAGRRNRGVKQAGFLVLRYATMPSVLVETGYLTNEVDEAFLMTGSGQEKMAISILNAFKEYKKEMEKGNDGIATVANFEVKNSHSFSSAKQEFRKEGFVGPLNKPSSNKIDQKFRKETELAKRKGLEIAPPTTLSPKKTKKAKTNTSPVRHSKILATSPVDSNPTTSVKILEHQTESRPVKANEEKADLFFCIQLAASPTLLNVRRGKWTRIKHSIEVIQEGSLYKYQVRNFATLENANAVKSRLRKNGFSDAFVVAYQNGKRIDPRTLKD